MATLQKGKTFTNGETVTPQKLHELVDLGSVTNIQAADIATGAVTSAKLADAAVTTAKLADAAVTDAKLATIATAGKVANSATTAVSGNAPNAIVTRDASGNFSAGTITAALSGNADTATRLQTARTINGVAFDGAVNITVTAAPTAHTHDDRYYTETEMNSLLDGKQAVGSYASASHTHAISDVTNLQTTLDGKAATAHTHDSSAINTGTLSNARTTATSVNTANAIVARDSNGDFYAGSIFSRKSSFLQADVSVYAAVASGSGAIGLIDIGQQNSNVGERFLGFFLNGSTCGSITRNGANSVAFNTSSDYRLKTNLEPLTDAVNRLLQIPVHRFNWVADPNAPKVDGFLAHEAQAVVPESVTGHKDEVDAEGNPVHQGIDQSKLVPLLVAAVQELAARVKALEAAQ